MKIAGSLVLFFALTVYFNAAECRRFSRNQLRYLFQLTDMNSDGYITPSVSNQKTYGSGVAVFNPSPQGR